MKGKLLLKKAIAERFSSENQKGVALVITLMIMLTLVLISLSLVVQSNTEHLISQNEQDSFRALTEAEGVVDMANREIRTWIVANRPDDLDPILGGILNSANEDYMVGFKSILNTGLTRSGLNNTNEETTSAIENNPFPGFTSGNWEVFRLGIDQNGDGNYDGNIRTVVYARLYDNFDLTQDADDTDLRMRLEVRSFYPVYVDNNGAEVTLSTGENVTASRGQAQRHLVARFGPTGSVAIRSDSNMRIDGSLQICGECGSAHANGTMTLQNGPSVCGNATGTSGFVNTSGTVLGDQGTQAEIYIPIVNPYNPLFVPEKSLFTVTTGFSHLQCAGPSALDPGNSKYYAIVKADNNTTLILKAYRNFGDTISPADTRWYWRVIGNSTLGNLDTIRLDNCGRVVQCGAGLTGCSPDQINGVNADDGVESANNTFYGFNPDNNLTVQACPTGGEFETIPSDTAPYSALAIDGSNDPNENEWNVNDFPLITSSNTTTITYGPRSANLASKGGTDAGLFTRALPGVGSVDGLTTGDAFTGASAADFNSAAVIQNGDFSTSGNDLYSPLYNAVLFVYGNVDFGGTIDELRYHDGTNDDAAIDINDDPLFDLDYTWRITVIAWGNVRAGGTTNINPPSSDPDYRWAIVSGRDIRLHGNANNMACNGTDCDGAPTGTEANFAGAYLAHESIGFNGTVGVNGYVIAEDRASCSQYEDSTVINGSLNIHYDCVNPNDYFSAESVRLREWEESQRVQ